MIVHDCKLLFMIAFIVEATRRRISALEAELVGLRAQIAAYALADIQNSGMPLPRIHEN